MGKKFQKQLEEYIDLFRSFTQENNLVVEIKSIADNVEEMLKSIETNKFDVTENVYNVMNVLFDKYKDNVKKINKQNKIFSEAMKKIKDLYKNDISKKIKDAKSVELTTDAFKQMKDVYTQFEDAIETLNEQTKVYIDTFKQIKDLYKQDSKSAKKTTTTAPKKTTKTAPKKTTTTQPKKTTSTTTKKPGNTTTNKPTTTPKPKPGPNQNNNA